MIVIRAGNRPAHYPDIDNHGFAVENAVELEVAEGEYFVRAVIAKHGCIGTGLAFERPFKHETYPEVDGYEWGPLSAKWLKILARRRREGWPAAECLPY